MLTVIQALAVAPEQVHFKFNVAFVQIQLAMTINSLSETQRNSLQLQDAADGLEAAITALDEIAASPHTPYPKHDIEQRANMARNTQRKQLERALASQKEYEEKNKEKFAAAMEQRQAELRRKEEERRKVEEVERERQEKIRREREEILARDRVLAEQRAEEERQRMEAEMTTDSETGEKIKKKRKAPPRGNGEPKPKKGRSRRKKSVTSDGDESGEELSRPKKKQKLIQRRREAANPKIKSAEIIEDSGSDVEDGDDALEKADRELERESSPISELDDGAFGGDKMETDAPADGDDDDEEDATVSRRQGPTRSRRARGVVDESDEEEGGDDDAGDAKEGDDGEGSPVAADTSMVDADDDE
jgi:RNA polymerase-associated protein CTR9